MSRITLLGTSALFSSSLLLAASAYGQAATNAAAAKSTGLEEIVVTAQKRSENVQSIPVAITAISASALQAKGIFQTTDLMGSLPNLQVTSPYASTQPNFSLRGISVANEFSASTASPVGVYVDEVYQSFRASHGQQLYDLERIEVLRGPQGTLYGRNTTGGAINFITRRPGLADDSGNLSFGYSSYSTFTLQGAGELTLVPDKLGVRAAFTWATGEGYTYNPVDKKTYGNTDTLAGRVTFRFKPSDDLDITLKGYGARNNPRQDLPYGIGYLAGRTDAGGYSRFLPRPELGGRILNQNEIQADQAGNYRTESIGSSLNISYNLGSVKLTSITGFDHGVYNLSPFDCDGSPTNICAIRYYSRSNNFNQDFRFTWNSDKLKLIAGLYYGKDTIKTINQPDFFGFLRPILLGAGLPGNFSNVPLAVPNELKTIPAALVTGGKLTDPGGCAPVVVNPNGFFDGRSLIAFQADAAANNSAGGPNLNQAACFAAGAAPFTPILAKQEYTISRPSYALYGEGKYSVTDALSVTLGLRYTRDKVRYYDAKTTIFGLDGKTPIATTVPFSFPYDPNAPLVSQEQSTGQLTGRFIADYKIAPDVLAYASYSHGYRAGTYNGLAYQDIGQVYFLKPEKVDAFEVGLKSRFLERRLQLNLAAFYYDYKNQQIAQVIGATSFLRSAKGRIFGGEAELSAQVFETLRFDASLGFLNSKYTGNKIDPTNPSSLTRDINGNPFPNAPNITATAGFDWTAYKQEDSKLTLHGDVQYMGKYYFDPFKNYNQNPCNAPAPGQATLAATPEIACGNPAYFLFNGRITYNLDKNIALSVWGKNLANKFYYVYGLNLNAFYEDYLTRGAPRTIGAEATVRF